MSPVTLNQLAGRFLVVLPPEVVEAEIVPRAVVSNPFFQDDARDWRKYSLDPICAGFYVAVLEPIHSIHEEGLGAVALTDPWGKVVTSEGIKTQGRLAGTWACWVGSLIGSSSYSRIGGIRRL